MENKALINKAIGFIQKNPKENLSLQSIADNAGFSLTYFDSIFRKHTGYSPVEYSRIYKLTRSAIELRRTDRTILDIALDFGYSSPESFTRAFKAFYSITPSEYRERYSNKPVDWHDLSSKIAISHFRHCLPELKPSDIDLALDFCFMHNPIKYAEDIIGMTVAESEILTIGDSECLEHFVYISDFNSAAPFVTLVCENEVDAIRYLKIFEKGSITEFSIRKSIDVVWDRFDAEVARQGLTCRYGFDMIYPYESISVPEYHGMSIRTLNVDDMSQIEVFKHRGGCAECHVRAIQISFEGKGNIGLMPIGIFKNNELVCLAMPALDQVRELKKYDIGAVFMLDSSNGEALELIWKYVIDISIKNGALLGNANAKDSASSYIDINTSERIGLVKVAENRIYSK